MKTILADGNCIVIVIEQSEVRMAHAKTVFKACRDCNNMVKT